MTRICGLACRPFRSFQIVVVLIFSPVTSWILKTTWASDRRPPPAGYALPRTQLTLLARVLGAPWLRCPARRYRSSDGCSCRRPGSARRTRTACAPQWTAARGGPVPRPAGTLPQSGVLAGGITVPVRRGRHGAGPGRGLQHGAAARNRRVPTRESAISTAAHCPRLTHMPEMSTSSARISMHELEYSLTLSRPCRRSP